VNYLNGLRSKHGKVRFRRNFWIWFKRKALRSGDDD
jgi:hypothetical protein